MKRFAMKEYGPADQVLIEIAADPRKMSEKHIRVALKAFGINPYDISLRQGKMQSFRKVNFPYVLGNDGAGIVTEVGSEVTNVKVGDEVLLHAVGGTYGEEIVLPAHKAVIKPEEMTWETAAAIPTTGITAYHLLFSLIQLKPSQTVMIQGASGGVGSILLQLAKQKGNRVLATASSKNQALVERLGADAFGAYDHEDVGELFREQADVVIDATKSSRSFTTGEKILKKGGTYVVLNDLPAENERTKEGNYLHYGPKKEYSDEIALAALTKAYENDHLSIKIAEVLPFELGVVITAHQQIEGHPPAGKIIIKR